MHARQVLLSLESLQPLLWVLHIIKRDCLMINFQPLFVETFSWPETFALYPH
jgi:hypothetical protein